MKFYLTLTKNFDLGDPQMFYAEKRPTLLYREPAHAASSQVERERRQIFRLINNSPHRCQGHDWQLGSCPQPARKDTVAPTTTSA